MSFLKNAVQGIDDEALASFITEGMPGTIMPSYEEDVNERTNRRPGGIHSLLVVAAWHGSSQKVQEGCPRQQKKDERRFKMMKIEQSVVINRPIEEVFDFFRLAEPLVVRMMRRQFENQFRQPEGPAGSPGFWQRPDDSNMGLRVQAG